MHNDSFPSSPNCRWSFGLQSLADDHCERCKTSQSVIQDLQDKNKQLECESYANQITIVFLKNQNRELVRKMEDKHQESFIGSMIEFEEGDKKDRMFDFIETFNPVQLKKLFVSSQQTKNSQISEKQSRLSHSEKESQQFRVQKKKEFNLREFTKKARERLEEQQKHAFQLDNF